ncbi:DUF3164 family protein [Lichenicola cladoniae]|uniref:DUF3164 family protein n=1 Tax=Lichenicola cladoniae TaxID=1484109 RepID=A0A6M8HN87_9PROT|nr:DUF3164 family protein [Lichenicola cladoniae]NPD67282.1 DUF3164 family protein [Acetobacteraceae bacterium]QKE89786.1 DUF3164 family protein [Lichenicola cladoniae]
MTATPDAPPAVPDGYARDAQGRLVPLSKVRPEDQLEDALVRGLISGADELREFMGGFRDKAYAEIKSLIDLLAEKYDTKLGGQKGNLQLTSFDGTLRVQVAIGDTLAFGPQLQVAKALIDECLVEWTEGGNDNVRALINDAFDVREKGKLPVDRILSLRRLDIGDERWKRAMDAISEAIRVESSKSYIRFYRRESPDAPWTALSLDIAKL